MSDLLFCSPEINYADVGGGVLPFTFTLDLVNSILTPTAGQNQKFCYTVTGVGSDNPDQKDLSHWILGICNQITADQIVQNTISVVIDDVPQTVVFGEGGNVLLVNPDPTTQCVGLKFDFPLNKIGGVMHVCFELTTTYPVGPNPVCVKGGEDVETGLSICGPACQEAHLCESVTFQQATVCVPVTVTPFAIPGPTSTICCGTPTVTPNAEQCPTGTRSCFFTVSQRICVRVPVAFGANTHVGIPQVACEGASGTGCPNCTSID